MKRCLYPKCNKNPESGSRGLCNTHYNRARRLVNDGKTTWEKLEQSGRVNPKSNRGTVIDNSWFLDN